MSRRLRAHALAVALTCVSLAALPPSALAYDFNVDATTIGQGYQLRAFRTSGDTLLNRRRLSTLLRLNVWNILSQKPDKPGDDATGKRKAQLAFVSYLRYAADFGDFLEDSAVSGSGTAQNPGIPELRHQQRALDLVYAYLDGQDLWGLVDFRLGRQITTDLLDWYAFDGLTLRLRTPLFVTLEASAGLEVRGDLAVSSPLYELDGVQDGTELREHLAPTFGGALELDGPRWAHARLSYRRTQSSGLTGDGDVDADLVQRGLDDDQQVLEEKLGLSLRAILLGGGLSPFAAARLNLLVHRFDELSAGTRVAWSPRHALTGEYRRSVPTWDGDSIFNVFTQYPYDDARLTYDVSLSSCVRAYLRGMGRWFHNHACSHDEQSSDLDCAADFDIATTVPDYGGGAGVRVDRRSATLRADAYYLDGFGGRHAGLDLAGQLRMSPRAVHLGGETLALDGRITLVSFDQPLKTSQHGISLGAQAGLSWGFHEGMAAHLWLEENVNRFYPSQLRVVGVLDLAYWP